MYVSTVHDSGENVTQNNHHLSLTIKKFRKKDPLPNPVSRVQSLTSDKFARYSHNITVLRKTHVKENGSKIIDGEATVTRRNEYERI